MRSNAPASREFMLVPAAFVALGAMFGGWLAAGLGPAAVAPHAFSIAGLSELFGLRTALASLIVGGFAICAVALRLRNDVRRAVPLAPQ
jgi:hypothetical protein